MPSLLILMYASQDKTESSQFTVLRRDNCFSYIGSKYLVEVFTFNEKNIVASLAGDPKPVVPECCFFSSPIT